MEVDNPTNHEALPLIKETSEGNTTAHNRAEVASAAMDNDSSSVTTPNTKCADVSPADTNSDKKRRIRRKHKGGKHHRKNKWKPYNKLSWDERRQLEEKEGRKAALKREERFASGQPMAPYNTTQFLMDIHDPEPALASTPQLENGKFDARYSHQSSGHTHDGSGSVESSDDYYSSPDDEEIFLEKEFSVDYENFHAEHLRSLSKEQLVKEYLEMEHKIEKLSKQLNEHDSSSSEKDRLDPVLQSGASEGDNCETLDISDTLAKIRAENEKLRSENEQLRQLAANMNSDKENNPES